MAVGADEKAAETIGQTRVQAVISAVKDGGLGGLEARVTRALRISEAGDEHTQSQDPRTISIIYLAELPGDEWLEWYGAQKEGVEGGAGSDLSSLGITQLPTIDLRKSERYVKVHKDASCTSLQRALADKTGYKLTTYCQLVAQLLNGNGLALAGNRWHRIKSKIEALWLHSRDRVLTYLWELFFNEWLGRGMLSDFGMLSYAAASSDDVNVRSRHAIAVNESMASSGAVGGFMGMASPMQQLQQMQLQQMLIQNQNISNSPSPSVPTNPYSNIAGYSQHANSTQDLIAQFAGMTAGGGSSQGGGQGRPEIEDLTLGPCIFCDGAHDTKNCDKMIKAKRAAKDELKEMQGFERRRTRTRRRWTRSL